MTQGGLAEQIRPLEAATIGAATMQEAKRKTARQGAKRETSGRVIGGAWRDVKHVQPSTWGLVNLLSERAALGEAGLTARGLAQDHCAVTAYYYSLGVREDSRDDVAARALDIHKVRVRRLYQSLQLVLLQFDRTVGVQQVGLEGLRDRKPKTGKAVLDD